MLERAYDQPSWHGTNLRGSLRGLTPELAGWRPAPGRHNIWELIVHAAYWKYVARARMTKSAPRPKFALGGHNWYERPGGPVRTDRSLAQLKADTALLDTEHQALLEFVRNLPPSLLHKKIGKSHHTYLTTIAGVAAHDVYHAGQIQLLKTLSRV
jgi:DinB family protein